MFFCFCRVAFFCLINRIFYFFLLTLQNVKKKDKNYEEE